MKQIPETIVMLLVMMLSLGAASTYLFETAHFSIFWSGKPQRNDIEALSETLEGAYGEYRPLFSVDPAARRPVNVVVFESTGDFCHHTGLPWWSASAMIDGAMYLQPVSVLNERKILGRVAAHETALVFIHERYGEAAPPWYAEGLAMYLAGEGEAARDGLSGDRPDIFSVSDIDELLSNREDREKNAWGYVLSYEEVSGLVEEYGLPAVAGEGERFFGAVVE